MRWREISWITFLTGLPFAHFLDRRVDIWHGQAAWGQAWVWGLFCATLLGGGFPLKPNRPFACWMLWVGLMSCWVWHRTLAEKQAYAAQALIPIFCCLWIVLFYYAAVSQWTYPLLEQLTLWISRAGIVVLVYCCLQLLSWDQFFSQFHTEQTKKDLLVGTIGNPSHLGTYIACLLPYLLIQRKRYWKLWSLLAIVMLLLTKSMGAWIAAFLSLTWMAFQTSKRLGWSMVGLGIIGSVVAYFLITPSDYLARSKVIMPFASIMEVKSITGMGPGFIFQMSKRITEGPLQLWRHTHNEYLQIGIEQGLVGLGIVLWGIWHWIQTAQRVPKTRLSVALIASFIAFTMNSFTSFPMHLWLLASFGLVSYCGIYALRREV